MHALCHLFLQDRMTHLNKGIYSIIDQFYSLILINSSLLFYFYFAPYTFIHGLCCEVYTVIFAEHSLAASFQNFGLHCEFNCIRRDFYLFLHLIDDLNSVVIPPNYFISKSKISIISCYFIICFLCYLK